MSLETILEKIHADGEKELGEVQHETRGKVMEIQQQAGQDVDRIVEEACARALFRATRQQARILQKARIEALQEVGRVREEFIDTALANIANGLAAARSTAGYRSILQRLMEEAVGGLSGTEPEENLQLVVDKRDKEIVEAILKSEGRNLQVVYGLDCAGGLITKSGDGKVTVNNTFESRLERATPFLRGYLAALFEGEAAPPP